MWNHRLRIAESTYKHLPLYYHLHERTWIQSGKGNKLVTSIIFILHCHKQPMSKLSVPYVWNKTE